MGATKSGQVVRGMGTAVANGPYVMNLDKTTIGTSLALWAMVSALGLVSLVNEMQDFGRGRVF